MIIYNTSGIVYSEGSSAKDIGYYTNIMPLPVTSLHKNSWHIAPKPIINCTALTAGAVTASGQNANLLISPPCPCYITGLAIRITTATAGIPRQSGIFAIYTNVTQVDDDNMSLFPYQKIYQSNPFYCGDTGVYATGLNIYLEPNSFYWLTLTTTRNATMHNVQVNTPDYYGRASSPGNTATVGYRAALTIVSDVVDNYFSSAAVIQAASQACIFYSLAKA